MIDPDRYPALRDLLTRVAQIVDWVPHDAANELQAPPDADDLENAARTLSPGQRAELCAQSYNEWWPNEADGIWWELNAWLWGVDAGYLPDDDDGPDYDSDYD